MFSVVDIHEFFFLPNKKYVFFLYKKIAPQLLIELCLFIFIIYIENMLLNKAV